MDINNNIINRLESLLGKKSVLTTDEERLCYSYDATGKEFLPEIIVKPSTQDEISGVIKIASEKRIPVIPRGSGTGFVGGSLPVQGGIVIALAGMNRILEIDEKNLMAVVEPGVITHSLQSAVEDLGLFYPPDPSSLKVSTLGGNTATCAGGPRAVKYGVTKDYVLGMTVVLPDGRVHACGGKLTKNVAGYDLTKLFVGSEGTLGLITQIIVKLLPLPETVSTALVHFKSIDDASQSVSDIIAAKIIPSTLEFIDKSALVCIENHSEFSIPGETNAILIIELDGEELDVKRQSEKVHNIVKKNNAHLVTFAQTKTDAEKLWNVRRSISPAVGKLRPTKLNQDIGVPRSKIPDMMRSLKSISEKNEVLFVNFGHAGDGNIHVNIMTDKNNPTEMAKAEQAVKEVFQSVLTMGGTISGEHGIGISKMAYLESQIGITGIELTRKIKTSFDPFNIMNPGKIIPDP